METNCIRIRPAAEEDAAAILAIYAPYVTETAITFEYQVPSLEEFAGRIRRILQKYPYLVAEREGEIVGYAYASPFHERAAYSWCAETTIYVKRDLRRMGVGRQLYDALEHALKAQGILNLNACIAYPEPEDQYLTQDSVRFHQHLGYTMVGQFHQCGYKFGRWYHMVWMEKLVGAHLEQQPPVRSFEQVLPELKELG